MSDERIVKLTERQRECLRLVLKHYTSKEMARELGVGVDAIDQRLKGAMKKLGVASRLEAARILATHEGLNGDVELVPIAPSALPPRAAKSVVGSRLNALKRLPPRTWRGRFVAAACLAGIAFGAVGMGAPLDLYLRDRHVAAHHHPVSDEIVSVEIDAASVRALGATPWPRRYIAGIIRRLDQMGATKIVCWVPLASRMDAAEDRALAQQIQSMGARVALVVDTTGDVAGGTPLLPLPEFRSRAALFHNGVISTLWTDRRVPYVLDIGGRSYPSGSSELAGVDTRGGQAWWARIAGLRLRSFPIDYSIDARTVPMISAVDLLRGAVPRAAISGKTISLVPSYRAPANRRPIPGIGEGRDAQIIVLAAETLLQGVPTEVPWTITFLPAILLVTVCGWLRRPIVTAGVVSAAIATLLLLPSLLFPQKIYIDVAPALFLIMLVGATFAIVFLLRRRSLDRPAKAG